MKYSIWFGLKEGLYFDRLFIVLMNTDRTVFGLPAIYMIMRDG